MSESLFSHEHGEDDCAHALKNVHAFLHGEMPEASADEIRQHLMACESCMDDFDIEATLTELIRRCCPPCSASETLRARISSLHVKLQQ